MCKFRVTFNPENEAQRELALRSLSMMQKRGASGSVRTAKQSVIGEFEHPGLRNDVCAAAAWAKDIFGMHPDMHPGVMLI